MDQTALGLVLQAGVVVKLVLLTLLFFSVVSWGIMLAKWRHFSKARGETLSFLRYFRSGKEAPGLNKVARACGLSPLANIYRSVYEDRDIEGIDGIRRAVRRYSALESAKLEGYLNFLATTGSTTPFIGLFGTVWGIMNAFRGIGSAGSASLAVVAPGIAEALITTAAGLAAAIPAVMGYNFFLSAARRMTIEMEDFTEDLLAFFSGMMDEDRKR
ncbi:MAG: MotA/TolQ/ExbB proton channel family protein [Nitrospirae bacterium]|nr:MotA/TolQ/ExbB proton channel family protein [Nitrospirota bacterium]MBF0590791.1 MotA/TolQ/ExbB proton channel family protein [Nitrospirota bacterium]